MWSRLINLVEECWLTVWRTAFSLIIGEAQDFACELLDARGNSLAHSPRAMPVFNLTLPRAVRAILERFPGRRSRPGDILTTNDPWICAGHLFDVAIVTPVFREGRVVAIIGTIGHVADIGGTKDSLRAREIYEEGFQIPPMKLYRAGVPNEDLLTTARRERPQERAGAGRYPRPDLRQRRRRPAARWPSWRSTASRISRRWPPSSRTARRRAMREAIRRCPTASTRARSGTTAWARRALPVRGRRCAGDEIDVDFPDAPPQQPRGGSNCTFGYTAAHTVYPLKCILSPAVPSNAGVLSALPRHRPRGQHPQLHEARGSSTCARAPAGTSRRISSWRWRGALPERVQAFTGLPASITLYGLGPDGRFFNDHLFQGGGQGASAQGDGKSGAALADERGQHVHRALRDAHASSRAGEEATFPTPAGPAGTGAGSARSSASASSPTTAGRYAGLFPDGVLTRTAGLFGGKPGGAVRGVLLDETGAVVKDYGVGSLVTLEQPDQVLELSLAGGAGYGDPRERPLAMIQSDLEHGYVTARGVVEDYRCEVRSDGSVARPAGLSPSGGRPA